MPAQLLKVNGELNRPLFDAIYAHAATLDALSRLRIYATLWSVWMEADKIGDEVKVKPSEVTRVNASFESLLRILGTLNEEKNADGSVTYTFSSKKAAREGKADVESTSPVSADDVSLVEALVTKVHSEVDRFAYAAEKAGKSYFEEEKTGRSGARGSVALPSGLAADKASLAARHAAIAKAVAAKVGAPTDPIKLFTEELAGNLQQAAEDVGNNPELAVKAAKNAGNWLGNDSLMRAAFNDLLGRVYSPDAVGSAFKKFTSAASSTIGKAASAFTPTPNATGPEIGAHITYEESQFTGARRIPGMDPEVRDIFGIGAIQKFAELYKAVYPAESLDPEAEKSRGVAFNSAIIKISKTNEIGSKTNDELIPLLKARLIAPPPPQRRPSQGPVVNKHGESAPPMPPRKGSTTGASTHPPAPPLPPRPKKSGPSS